MKDVDVRDEVPGLLSASSKLALWTDACKSNAFLGPIHAGEAVIVEGLSKSTTVDGEEIVWHYTHGMQNFTFTNAFTVLSQRIFADVDADDKALHPSLTPEYVNGVRDMVNFSPLRVDFPDVPTNDGWLSSAWIYLPDSDIEICNRLPSSVPDYTLNKLKNHAKLLAEMIPPLSSPAGGKTLGDKIAQAHKFDMNEDEFKVEPLWPTTRPGKSLRQQSDKQWLHGDYKDAPFLLTHTLYRNIKIISNKALP